jgi:hypothetical protein
MTIGTRGRGRGTEVFVNMLAGCGETKGLDVGRLRSPLSIRSQRVLEADAMTALIVAEYKHAARASAQSHSTARENTPPQEHLRHQHALQSRDLQATRETKPKW